MTNKTEDKFYFGKHGQPERFGGFSGLGEWKIDFRNVMKERVDQLKQLAKTLKASVTLDRISPNGYYSGSVSRRYGAMEPPDLSAPGKVKALIQSLGGYIGAAFSRPGQPERFAREVIARKGNKRVELSGPMSDGRWTVTVMEENKQVVPGEVNERFVESKFYSTEAGARRAASKMLASRPGQPERFAISSSDLNYAKSQIRSASPERLREIEQELLTLAKSGDNNANTLLAYLKSEWDERYRGTHSRPGQPERFDASSLNRGNFAEASSSPMLGKLLSEKQMPEGGWRAVETGGGALVISFEDGDVAGNFARRVAGSGYSATAPVQSIGRYWNVEVKNGK